MTLCLVIMGRYVPSLEFLDVLLGDRPALSPVNTFYQRILADDPDETSDQAAKLLADRSLLDYYDGVVLPALRLAAEDLTRGTITRARSLELTRSMLIVIEDLNGHVDRQPENAPGARAATPGAGIVACVAGRGAFDDVVSAMLAQLLQQRGATTQRVPHAAMSRSTIAQLDLSGVTAVALSYLEPSVAPANVRNLVRRLRAHAPQSAIIVGLWSGADDPMLNDPTLQRELGADSFSQTLRQAVDAALTAIRTGPVSPTSVPY
jgi:hypothetical protein